MSDEEKSWWKGGGSVNVCDFGGAVRELSKIIRRFGWKGVAVADGDWNEDDWESVWTERRFDLGKEDESGDLINDDCDKHDDDCDDSGDNTSCNVSIINLRIWCFDFQLGERDLYNIVPCLENCLAKSSLGLGAWESFFWIFCNSHWSY